MIDAGVDLAATFIPFVPAGATKIARAGAKAVKSIDKTADIGKTAKAVHGNSKASSKAQHLYEIFDRETKEVVKTGISGGKKTKAGKSYRANSQVNRWNKEAGHKKFDSEVVQDFPAGPNARDKALDAEKTNAEKLRVLQQLKDPNYHKIP